MIKKKKKSLSYLRQCFFQICAPCIEDGRIVEDWSWMMKPTWNIIVETIECLQCTDKCTLIHSIHVIPWHSKPFSSHDEIFQSVYFPLLLRLIQIALYVCLRASGFFFLLLHFTSICFENQKVWMVKCLMIVVWVQLLSSCILFHFLTSLLIRFVYFVSNSIQFNANTIHS